MVVEETCDECEETHEVCPSCGSTRVTKAEWIMVNGAHRPPVTATLTGTLLDAEDGDVVSFGTVCWECGWEKTRTMEIEVTEE